MPDTDPPITAASLPDDLPLSGVLPDFVARGFKLPPSASYHGIWKAVVNGRLAAHQVNGRYRIRRSDMGAVAAFLGLTPPASAKPARKAATNSVAA